MKILQILSFCASLSIAAAGSGGAGFIDLCRTEFDGADSNSGRIRLPFVNYSAEIIAAIGDEVIDDLFR